MIPGQLPAVAPAEVGGIASLAVRDLLHGPYQAGQLLAVVQGTLIAEFPGAPREPRVIVISAPDAVRLPNAIIASIPVGAMTGEHDLEHRTNLCRRANHKDNKSR